MAADLSNSFKSRTIPPPECRVSLTQSAKIAKCISGHHLCWNCKQRPEMSDCPSSKMPIHMWESFRNGKFPQDLIPRRYRVNFSRWENQRPCYCECRSWRVLEPKYHMVRMKLTWLFIELIISETNQILITNLSASASIRHGSVSGDSSQ